MAMVTDPIADMLARIRNSSLAEHEKVDIPASRLKIRLAELLKDEGFIKNFRVIEDRKQGTLRVYLKYGPGQERVITGLRRVSKPGRRQYVGADRVPNVLGGMGVAILSTPRGVLPDREARRLKVGGEVLCYVW
jgi:small subunit ribosomal protein S8